MCDQPIQLSHRQWELLSAISFGLFGTGQRFADRPQYDLTDKVLSIKFPSTDAFKAYTRRAFTVTASRLVAFRVHEVTDTKISCRALFNQTEALPIDGAVIAGILGLKQ